MSSHQRVFITGCGSVSSLVGEAGSAGLPLSLCVPSAITLRRRMITDFDPSGFVSESVCRRMDRFTLLAFVAVKKALQCAELEIRPEKRERTGLIFNTCYGPFDSTRRYLIKLIRDGAKKAPAAVFPNTVHNAFTGLITMDLKALGTNSTISGHNPICYGLDMIREGRDDVMIVGGCDELIGVIADGFERAEYLADDDDTPTPSVFDLEQNGFALGEGAAALVLESEDSVRARGGRVLAEVLDYGLTNSLNDGPSAFPADIEGIEVAMQQALARSGVAPTEVDFVSAAANGLPHLARAERTAIDRVLGADDGPWVGSIKGALGETLGASSAFSALLAVQALESGLVPATWGPPADSLPLRYVAGEPVAAEIGVALINSLELGGSVTSLVLRKVSDSYLQGDLHAS